MKNLRESSIAIRFLRYVYFSVESSFKYKLEDFLPRNVGDLHFPNFISNKLRKKGISSITQPEEYSRYDLLKIGFASHTINTIQKTLIEIDKQLN